MTPPIIANAGPLLVALRRHLLRRVGRGAQRPQAYAEAGEALARFRGRGGTVILVSNAPIPRPGVERVLEKTGVRRDAWDAIVSSGDIALDHIAAKGYRRMHWVGPSERDYALYVRLPGAGRCRSPRPRPSSARACGTTAPRRWRTIAA